MTLESDWSLLLVTLVYLVSKVFLVSSSLNSLQTVGPIVGYNNAHQVCAVGSSGDGWALMHPRFVYGFRVLGWMLRWMRIVTSHHEVLALKVKKKVCGCPVLCWNWLDRLGCAEVGYVFALPCACLVFLLVLISAFGCCSFHLRIDHLAWRASFMRTCAHLSGVGLGVPDYGRIVERHMCLWMFRACGDTYLPKNILCMHAFPVSVDNIDDI
jgi:hypothetical protein